MFRLIRTAALLGAMSLLAACASNKFSSPAENQELRKLVAKHPVHQLPAPAYFPQREYHCGPAALAMVLSDLGYPASPAQMAQLTYVPARKGSLTLEMMAAARQVRTYSATVPPRIDKLLAEVLDGNSPIVLLNLGLDWAPNWHYATVVGYDMEHWTITLRSGVVRRERLSIGTFDHVWSRAGRWAMTIHRPGSLPAHQSQIELFRSARAFERLHPGSAALQVWRSLHQRWPDKTNYLLGMGNQAYRTGHFELARTAFEKAAKLRPASAIAWNNLAVVLTAQKRFDHAERSVNRAKSDNPAVLAEISRTRDALNQAQRLRK